MNQGLKLHRLAVSYWPSILLLVVFAGSSLAKTSRMAPLEELWQSSQVAYQENRLDEAHRLLTEWEQVAKTFGLRSSQVHNNLGLLSIEKSDWPLAQWHLLRSLSSSNNPLRSFYLTGVVREIESEAGVSSGVSSQLAFVIGHLIPRNIQFVLILCSFWLLLFSAALVFRFGKEARILGGGLGVLSLLCVMGSLAGYVCQSQISSLAVVKDGGDGISFYNADDDHSQKPVGKLYAGTIVRYRHRPGSRTLITSPIYGSVEKSTILTLSHNAQPSS